MKKITFILMLVANCSISDACNETNSVVDDEVALTHGKPITKPNPNDGNATRSCGSDDIIDLDNITAQVGFVFYGNGLGGLAGVSWALSLTGGGGGNNTVVIANQVPSDMGCDGDYTSAERLAVANSAFQALISNMEFFIDNEDTGWWDGSLAELWLLLYNRDGATYSFEFPDGTTGEYEVGNNDSLTSEESCQQSPGGGN